MMMMIIMMHYWQEKLLSVFVCSTQEKITWSKINVIIRQCNDEMDFCGISKQQADYTRNRRITAEILRNSR